MFDDLQESQFNAADWAEVTKLKHVFEQGGQDALVETLTALVHGNRDCYLRIMEVLNPGYEQWNESLEAEKASVREELRKEKENKAD
jgi:hypothetical protein